MSGCKAEGCAAQLGPKNASGYCRKHYSPYTSTPERSAKISAAKKRYYRENPEARAKARERCIELARLPQTREASRRTCLNLRLWEKGHAAMTPETRKKAGQRSGESRMAWCPKELLPAYRKLVYSSRLRMDEAKVLILEEHEANLRRLRTKMGVSGPVKVREVVYFPDRLTEREPGTDITAERQKAEKARVDALRQRRTLCPICGARSDIGCEHGAAA